MKSKMSFRPQKSNLFVISLLMIILLKLLGCTEKDDATETTTCQDALCYPICLKNLDSQTNPSFWVVTSAFCKGDENCACYYGCGDAECDQYCKESERYESGRCEGFKCLCRQSVEKADGGDDAGDAG